MARTTQSIGAKTCPITGNTYELFLVSDPGERCAMTEVVGTTRSGTKFKVTSLPLEIDKWRSGLVLGLKSSAPPRGL